MQEDKFDGEQRADQQAAIMRAEQNGRALFEKINQPVMAKITEAYDRRGLVFTELQELFVAPMAAACVVAANGISEEKRQRFVLGVVQNVATPAVERAQAHLHNALPPQEVFAMAAAALVGETLIMAANHQADPEFSGAAQEASYETVQIAARAEAYHRLTKIGWQENALHVFSYRAVNDLAGRQIHVSVEYLESLGRVEEQQRLVADFARLQPAPRHQEAAAQDPVQIQREAPVQQQP